MSRDAARFISSFLTVALFVGTLMPGSWKDAAASPFPRSLDLAVIAHIALFAGICFTMAPARFWDVRSWHVLTVGLALALLTEGLQFFAIERHPNLDGVLQDMIGVVGGVGVGAAARRIALLIAATDRTFVRCLICPTTGKCPAG
jgi:hypothetical protein